MRALLTPSVDDRPGFHLNIPISELTGHDTQAIEAGVVSSAPSVAETEDGVTHETRPTPFEPHGARGSSRLILDREIEDRRPPAMGLRPPRVEQRAGGESADEPLRCPSH